MRFNKVIASDPFFYREFLTETYGAKIAAGLKRAPIETHLSRFAELEKIDIEAARALIVSDYAGERAFTSAAVSLKAAIDSRDLAAIETARAAFAAEIGFPIESVIVTL